VLSSSAHTRKKGVLTLGDSAQNNHEGEEAREDEKETVSVGDGELGVSDLPVNGPDNETHRDGLERLLQELLPPLDDVARGADVEVVELENRVEGFWQGAAVAQQGHCRLPIYKGGAS